MYETMFQPITIGGLTLKNRIVFAPTTLGLSEEEYREKIRAIAAGGCAMVIIGDVPVGRHGPMSLYSRKGFAHYQALCRLVHEQGCLICAQLHQSDSDFKAMIKYIPGILTRRISMEDLRPLLNQQASKLVTEMSADRAAEIAASFGPAAVRAAEAGFDMVQVHGDRMCGSFSSALMNHRTDRYGGSPQNRARFAVEAVTAVRKAAPGMAIDYKLPVRQENPHYGNAGVLVEELPVFVSLLERAGADSFHVTLANHAKLTDTIPPKNHPYFSAEGCFLPYCDQVRQYTALPLCGVGGLTDPDFVEEQLSSGRIQLAAMSRQLIADPQWPQKVREGRLKELHRCVRCNKACLGGMQQHKGVHCIYDRKN
ncbi:bilirubin reductase [Pseudoflavonifractor sp.]|jgi:2,4-dienoyl-CoA reductase-like NADH-dependent reductase (Old Yellow Enzyme family)|uniref:bilirubin reductase n=1 Tax=Pseudoflavonifractor sp. TaxID=1980281 RepID=UPI003D8C7902